MFIDFPIATDLPTKATFGKNAKESVETSPSRIQKFRWSCMQDFLLKGLPEKEVSFCGSVANVGCFFPWKVFLVIWKCRTFFGGDVSVSVYF